jgi:hypothetical protein
MSGLELLDLCLLCEGELSLLQLVFGGRKDSEGGRMCWFVKFKQDSKTVIREFLLRFEKLVAVTELLQESEKNLPRSETILSNFKNLGTMRV